MKKWIIFTLGLMSTVLIAQTPNPAPSDMSPVTEHLSQQEIDAAVASKSNSGFAYMEDMGFTTASACQAQMPSEAIFTPSGWIKAKSENAKATYLPFTPSPDDTLKALTVISKGCANGTASGPVCDSITRVALLSDVGGSTVAEAVKSYPLASTWQNAYGATAACSSLVSKFSMSDVAKVTNSKGEFLIVTFSGQTRLKIYTVKKKHLKLLGI